MASTDEIDEYLTQIRNYTESIEEAVDATQEALVTEATGKALDALAQYSNDRRKQYYLSNLTVLNTVAECKIYKDDPSTITYATTFLLNLSEKISLCYRIAYSNSVLGFLLNIIVEEYNDIPYKARSRAVKVLFNLAYEPECRFTVGKFRGMLHGLASCWAGMYSDTRKLRVLAGKTVLELVKESRGLVDTTEFGMQYLIRVVEKIVSMLNADDEIVRYCLDVLLEMLKALENKYEFRDIADEAGLTGYAMEALLANGNSDDEDDDDDDDGDSNDNGDGDDDGDDFKMASNFKKAKKIWKVLY